MGLKETESETRWTHTPKKKWIHCYLSVDEGGEIKSEPVQLSSGGGGIDSVNPSGKCFAEGDDGACGDGRVFVPPPSLIERRVLTLPHNVVSCEKRRARGSPPVGSLLRDSPTPKEYDIRVSKSPTSDDEFAREEYKKRTGNTPSREVHNKLEKNRRAHLKDCFESLRRQLPSMEDKKISNQTILKAASRYITNLKRKEKDFEIEMERLARQKIAYQQQLSSLKRDLSARWDHIDFSTIMPSSLETQRESTTTASEGPELETRDEEPLNLSTTSSSNSSSVKRTSLNRLHPYRERRPDHQQSPLGSSTNSASFSPPVVTSSIPPQPQPLPVPRVPTDTVTPLNSVPAQLVASSVRHLSGQHGTLIGQPLRMITPDGYKIIPADHVQSGAKPLAITLAHHSGGMERYPDDAKVMLAVNKNGLSTLQLAVPPRTIFQGTNASGSIKGTQTTSLIPSYLPLANGITQIVSIVGPIVVSQAQRGVVMSQATTKGGATLPVVVVSTPNR